MGGSIINPLNSSAYVSALRFKVQYSIETPQPLPKRLKQKVGYDSEKTLELLRVNWTPRQWEQLHQHSDPALVTGLLQASEWPSWAWADEAAWVGAYFVFLSHFQMGDKDWEEILFKVWVGRVLNYTLRDVVRGYDAAIDTLREMVNNACNLAKRGVGMHRNGK